MVLEDFPLATDALVQVAIASHNLSAVTQGKGIHAGVADQVVGQLARIGFVTFAAW